MSMTFATDVIVNNGYKFNNGRIFSGTCSTAAATTTKAVTCAEFTANDLVKGAAIMVTFDNTNSGAVASLKMNVNSTGDKAIKCLLAGALANLPAVGYLLASETYLFFYDGTNWVTTVDRDNDTNTKVQQNAAITTAGAYPVILGYDTSTGKVTNVVNKATLTYNPSTKALSTGSGTVDGYTLAAASAKGVRDASSATTLSSSGTNLLTERCVYYAGFLRAAVKVDFATTSGTTSKTVSNSAITANSVCIGVSKEASAINFKSDISFSTSAGSVTATYTKRNTSSITFSGYFIDVQ